MMKYALTLLLALSVNTAAFAQSADDYRQRQADLTALSEIFGELHFIRRTCEPNTEADLWRDRMKKMVDLEEPTASLQASMASSFNQGYRRAEKNFKFCDRNARDYAALRALQGDSVLRRLSAPLYEAATGESGPLVISIPQNTDD